MDANNIENMTAVRDFNENNPSEESVISSVTSQENNGGSIALQGIHNYISMKPERFIPLYKFSSDPGNDDYSLIMVTNKEWERAAFRVSYPDRYQVFPSAGVIDRGEDMEVQVIIKASVARQLLDLSCDIIEFKYKQLTFDDADKNVSWNKNEEWTFTVTLHVLLVEPGHEASDEAAGSSVGKHINVLPGQTLTWREEEVRSISTKRLGLSNTSSHCAMYELKGNNVTNYHLHPRSCGIINPGQTEIIHVTYTPHVGIPIDNIDNDYFRLITATSTSAEKIRDTCDVKKLVSKIHKAIAKNGDKDEITISCHIVSVPNEKEENVNRDGNLEIENLLRTSPASTVVFGGNDKEMVTSKEFFLENHSKGSLAYRLSFNNSILQTKNNQVQGILHEGERYKCEILLKKGENRSEEYIQTEIEIQSISITGYKGELSELWEKCMYTEFIVTKILQVQINPTQSLATHSYHQGKHLKIFPKSQVYFKEVESYGQYVKEGCVTLENIISQDVGYRIKASNPDLYHLKANHTGILSAGEHETISIFTKKLYNSDMMSKNSLAIISAPANGEDINTLVTKLQAADIEACDICHLKPVNNYSEMFGVRHRSNLKKALTNYRDLTHLRVVPGKSLNFKKDSGTALTANIKMFNLTSSRVAFKIRSNKPSRYLISTHMGSIERNGSLCLQVRMVCEDMPLGEEINNDILSIISCQIDNDVDSVMELFQRENKNYDKLAINCHLSPDENEETLSFAPLEVTSSLRTIPHVNINPNRFLNFTSNSLTERIELVNVTEKDVCFRITSSHPGRICCSSHVGIFGALEQKLIDVELRNDHRLMDGSKVYVRIWTKVVAGEDMLKEFKDPITNMFTCHQLTATLYPGGYTQGKYLLVAPRGRLVFHNTSDECQEWSSEPLHLVNTYHKLIAYKVSGFGGHIISQLDRGIVNPGEEKSVCVKVTSLTGIEDNEIIIQSMITSSENLEKSKMLQNSDIDDSDEVILKCEFPLNYNHITLSDSDTYHGKYATVTPGFILHYQISSVDQSDCRKVKITNISHQLLGYKLKFSKPDKYKLNRPHMGLIECDRDLSVTVTLKYPYSLDELNEQEMVVEVAPVDEDNVGTLGKLGQFMKCTQKKEKIKLQICAELICKAVESNTNLMTPDNVVEVSTEITPIQTIATAISQDIWEAVNVVECTVEELETSNAESDTQSFPQYDHGDIALGKLEKTITILKTEVMKEIAAIKKTESVRNNDVTSFKNDISNISERVKKVEEINQLAIVPRNEGDGDKMWKLEKETQVLYQLISDLSERIGKQSQDIKTQQREEIKLARIQGEEGNNNIHRQITSVETQVAACDNQIDKVKDSVQDLNVFVQAKCLEYDNLKVTIKAMQRELMRNSNKVLAGRIHALERQQSEISRQIVQVKNELKVLHKKGEDMSESGGKHLKDAINKLKNHVERQVEQINLEQENMRSKTEVLQIKIESLRSRIKQQQEENRGAVNSQFMEQNKNSKTSGNHQQLSNIEQQINSKSGDKTKETLSEEGKIRDVKDADEQRLGMDAETMQEVQTRWCLMMEMKFTDMKEQVDRELKNMRTGDTRENKGHWEDRIDTARSVALYQVLFVILSILVVGLALNLRSLDLSNLHDRTYRKNHCDLEFLANIFD